MRGRRDEADDVDPMLRRVRQKQVGFLGRQVDDNQPVHAGGGGGGAEAGRAIAVDRVEVTHQDDRGVAIFSAEGAHHLERAGQRRAGLEPAQPSGLDDRAVGHRVGERHADLDQVGACRRHAPQDRQRGRPVWVERFQERDQRTAAFLAQGGELGGDPAHSSTPRCWATEKMSLSPRPHRFISTMASRSSVGASFCT